MSHIDCLFKSIEGVGSIFITNSHSISSQTFKKYGCKSLMVLSNSKRNINENQKYSSLKEINFRRDLQGTQLLQAFHRAADFVNERKKCDNIIIWTPQSYQFGIVFFFAYLVLTFGYTLQYITRIYEKKIKNVHLSQFHIQHINNLTKKEGLQQESNEKMDDSPLGKRILRIRKGYSDLAKDSHAVSEQIRKVEALHHMNPQRQIKLRFTQRDSLDFNDGESVFVIKKVLSTKSDYRNEPFLGNQQFL